MKNILVKTSRLFYVASIVFTLAAFTITISASPAAKVGNNLFSISNSTGLPESGSGSMSFKFDYGDLVYGNFVNVFNVEELYSAVNNPQNAGRKIVIASGVYMLSANGPDGLLRPNRGRLELQENMSLLGFIGYREAVVIDAINLPANSYSAPPIPLTGAIRMGRGANSIEWLTVRNAVNGAANIETELVSTGTAYIRIAHIVSTNSQRGIDV